MKAKKKSLPQTLASRVRAKRSILGKTSAKNKAKLSNKKTKYLSENAYQLAVKKSACYQDLSDSDLVIEICTKNREAYGDLLTRYYRKLFTYVFHLVGNKDETEDILQNVFSKTYKNIEKFDTSKKFSSWIYRIAHNESINFLKRKNKRYTVSWDDITTTKDKLNTASNEELPEEKWEHMEIVREIDDALEKLPKKYKQILRMRYFEEHSYESIGKIIGKPVNTVGTLINRAKKKLFVVVQDGDRKRS